jgi:hypothetical protein
LDPARGKEAQGAQAVIPQTGEVETQASVRPKRTPRNGTAPSRGGALGQLLSALRAARQGDFSVRLKFDLEHAKGANGNGSNGHPGINPGAMRAIATEFNAMVALNEALGWCASNASSDARDA